MKCDRCGRAMAYEQFTGEEERFWGWRCIFCGEIIDEVIIENRQWLKTGVGRHNKKDPERPRREVNVKFGEA